MSSTFYVLCLSHDPAIVAGEFNNDKEAAEKYIRTNRGAMHLNCDLLVERMSGAPVEFGCIGDANSPCGGHSETRWADADWVRLLSYFEPDDPREDLKVLRSRWVLRCWTPDRVHRLRNSL